MSFASLPDRPQLTIQPLNFARNQPASWQPLVDTVRAADAAGVDRVILSDHVVFGSDLDAYGDPGQGGTAGGRQPTGPDGHWLEPITTLAYVAALTARVRLGTSILLAALRRPAVLAKSLATLDVLSGGRVDLGVGVGWQRAEYEAAGLDFSRRGRLLDHTLEVCEALWGDDPVVHQSEELTFRDTHANPKPAQSGGVPIWVSGTVNPRSMRRLARFGSGWIPWGPAVADPLGGIARMQDAVAEHGRDPSSIQVTCYLPVVRTDAGIDLAATIAGAPELRDAGATDFKLSVPMPQGESAATDYLTGVVEAFRAELR